VVKQKFSQTIKRPDAMKSTLPEDSYKLGEINREHHDPLASALHAEDHQVPLQDLEVDHLDLAADRVDLAKAKAKEIAVYRQTESRPRRSVAPWRMWCDSSSDMDLTNNSREP
jgi:hypothetical protein